MSKEIEFRGKRLDNGEWLYGDLMHDNHGGCYIYPLDCLGLFVENKVANDTIGQFTGQYDKKGKPIYEGDIFDLREFCIKVVYEVDMSRFVLRTDVEKSWMLPLDKAFCSHCAIVGNIHDNPELLDAK